jgi:hypothetical protein
MNQSVRSTSTKFLASEQGPDSENRHKRGFAQFLTSYVWAGCHRVGFNADSIPAGQYILEVRPFRVLVQDVPHSSHATYHEPVFNADVTRNLIISG